MKLDAIETLAIEYHKTQEGEYGCNGITCPGVQRLVAFGRACAAAGQAALFEPLMHWSETTDCETTVCGVTVLVIGQTYPASEKLGRTVDDARLVTCRKCAEWLEARGLRQVHA